MGQYGALGYALEDGWSYQQILEHYYGQLVDGGATELGTLAQAQVGTTGLNSDQAPIRVDLDQLAGQPVTVTSASAFTVTGTGLASALSVPAGGAVRFELVGSTPQSASWEVFVNDGGGPGACAGGANGWGAPVASGVQDPTATPSSPAPFPATGPIDDQLLEVCSTGGFYRGSISGAVEPTQPPVAQTVDTLPLGQYVADSAAAESPGDWATLGAPGPQGQPAGFQQTEAQVVAARSYAVAEALAGGYDGVAAICASTACQAYPGVADENPEDDLAALDTAGQVVLLPDGAPALTEYSASTGGETAPGSGPGGFAAVVDQGDGICNDQVCNPYHAYLATVPASAIEAAYPSIGTFQSLTVLQRNGLGPLGGRVLTLQLTGSAGTVTTSGSAFAAAVAASTSDQLDAPGGTFAASGILSDWFGLAGTQGTAETGYWLDEANGGVLTFGDAPFFGSAGDLQLAAPVVGMAATPGDAGYWLVAADGGVFSFGDAPYLGNTYSLGLTGLGGARPLAAPVVGMAAAPGGGGYWLVGADGGVFSFGDAPYLGSLPASGVSARAVALLPTADGQGYLIVTATGQAYPFGDAVALGSAPTGLDDVVGGAVDGA
jgi:hypothetical protein